MIHATLLAPLLSQMQPLEHVVDKPVIQWHGFWLLSNNLIGLIVSAVLMLIIFPLITRSYVRGEHETLALLAVGLIDDERPLGGKRRDQAGERHGALDRLLDE